MYACTTAVAMSVCDFSRGLEDVKVSCASIHSDHSSGLSKTLQEYRYAHVFIHFSHLIDLLNKALIGLLNCIHVCDQIKSQIALNHVSSGRCFSGRMRSLSGCPLYLSSS